MTCETAAVTSPCGKTQSKLQSKLQSILFLGGFWQLGRTWGLWLEPEVLDSSPEGSVPLGFVLSCRAGEEELVGEGQPPSVCGMNVPIQPQSRPTLRVVQATSGTSRTRDLTRLRSQAPPAHTGAHNSGAKISVLLQLRPVGLGSTGGFSLFRWLNPWCLGLGLHGAGGRGRLRSIVQHSRALPATKGLSAPPALEDAAGM